MGPRVLLAILVASAVAAAGELFNEKVAVLESFPREIPPGKTLVIKGSCRGAYQGPELILIAPRGKTYLNGEQEINGADFTFTVRFEEGLGPYRLELIASTPDATRSAARFTIYHGVRKPEVEPEEPPSAAPKTPLTIHERLLEKRMLTAFNDFRRSIGSEPAGWNEAVAARAREHAQRMAEADRRQHRFGKGGSVPEALIGGGAGDGGLSGPPTPWVRIDAHRPFPPPSPGSPGPRVFNHVVVQLVSGESLEDTFERFFVREAAFRICAADPHCVELAIGAARLPAPKPKTGKPPPPPSLLVYYCVCFVQVNEKPVIRGQDDAFDALLHRARDRDPDVLRALGCWSRPRAWRLLDAALDDPRPEIAAAAFDGLLLLDEDRARGEYAKRTATREREMQERRYADVVALLEPFRHVAFDREFASIYETARRDALAAARLEIAALADLPPEQRATRAGDIRRRAKGLGLDEEIDKAVAKG